LPCISLQPEEGKRRKEQGISQKKKRDPDFYTASWKEGKEKKERKKKITWQCNVPSR